MIRPLALLTSLALLATSPVVAPDPVAVVAAASRTPAMEAPPGPTQGFGPAPSANVRCTDAAGTWLGTRWRGPYRWWFNAASTPDYLGPDAAREAARAAARNVDDGRNDCGLYGGLNAGQRYLGKTGRVPGVGANGSCGARDGRNVVAFGELPVGLLALTCLWWVRGRGGEGRTVEADMRISDVPGLFLLHPFDGCGERWDLEGTLTHEFGHVFGLGHVPYVEHGSLTMSDGLPACTAIFRSLGLGDLLTLRRHYKR